jgi:hypothetical protein
VADGGFRTPAPSEKKTEAMEGGASRRPPPAAPGPADQLAGRRWRLRASPPPISLLPAATEIQSPPSPPGRLLRRARPEQGRRW